MRNRVSGMGKQDKRAEKEILLVAEYYEASRMMNEGQNRLAEKQDPADPEVRYFLSGAVRRYEKAIAAINAAGIGPQVFKSRKREGGACV